MSIRIVLTISSDSNESLVRPRRQDSDNLTNIFGKSPQLSVKLRSNIKQFSTKVKIYCALHNPLGYAQYYHLAVLTLLFLSVIVFNLFDEDKTQEDTFERWTRNMKICTDSILSVLLLCEILVRIWSSDCIYEYRFLVGKGRYLLAHKFLRFIDVFGITMFVVFVVNELFIQNFVFNFAITIRLSHLVQVFQLHRLLFRVIKLMNQTIYSQKDQISVVLMFAFFTVVFTSFCIYLIEREVNPEIHSIFSAFWLTFVTFMTIGYGDKIPVTVLGKIVILFTSLIGCLLFALPANIFGTGLALKIQEEMHKTEIYSEPSARLIQSVWRYYASTKPSKSTISWKFYRRIDGQSLSVRDRGCIRFIRIVMYLKAKQRFKTYMGLQNEDYIRERNANKVSLRIDCIKKLANKLETDICDAYDKLEKTNNLLNTLIDKFAKIQTKYKQSIKATKSPKLIQYRKRV